jgi:hypothetical protein
MSLDTKGQEVVYFNIERASLLFFWFIILILKRSFKKEAETITQV